MEFCLTSLSHGPIVLNPEFPSEFSDLIAADSKIGYAQGGFGKLLFQKKNTNQLNILFNVYQALEKTTLHFSTENHLLQVRIAMKNAEHFNIRGIGDINLKEGQFNIISAPGCETVMFLEGGAQYKTFNMFFPLQFLQQYLPLFPSLQGFLEKANSGKPALLFRNNGWITGHVIESINRLLRISTKEEGDESDFEKGFKELLFFLLLYHNVVTKNSLTSGKMEAVYKAKNIIEQNISRQLTMRQVARMIGMNEHTLKAAFKQVFQIGIFEYMVRQKMEKAKALLLETEKPIKEIAVLSGYTKIQNFVAAFKRYFHVTPSSFRKYSM